jgi:hypothetical protein
MTVQTINIGNRVNDGLGDDLRTAFQKVNANFENLSEQLTITVSSSGTTGSDIFKEKIGSNLVFKGLVSGTKMLLDDTGDNIIFNNTAPDAFYKFDTDSGNITAGPANSNGHITLQGTAAPNSISGTKDIQVSVIGNDQITFNTVVPVTDILLTFDFGPISGVYNNAVQLAVSQSNLDFGTIDIPGRMDLDFGEIS